MYNTNINSAGCCNDFFMPQRTTPCFDLFFFFFSFCLHVLWAALLHMYSL
jgi:hypothetical protein